MKSSRLDGKCKTYQLRTLFNIHPKLKKKKKKKPKCIPIYDTMMTYGHFREAEVRKLRLLEKVAKDWSSTVFPTDTRKTLENI